MKIRIVLLCGLLLSATGFVRAADEPAKAEAPKADMPKAQPSKVESEMMSLVEKIKAKLAKGENTEAALADELKAFDALIAEHKTEKTEEVAQISIMKALLYVQVLGEFDKGREFFTQVQTDFPGTHAAQMAGDVLVKLEQQKASMALQDSLKPGVAFPDFNEKDLTGAPLSISGLKGKVVLVDFWATWCGPCVAELPNVLAAYSKYHDKGFEIVGISLDRSEDALKNFIKEKSMTWPQYFDGKAWDSKLGKQYGVTSIPATYLIGQDGTIVAKNLRGPALEAELARLLGGTKS